MREGSSATAPSTAGSWGAILTLPFILALHLQQQEELVSVGAGPAPPRPLTGSGATTRRGSLLKQVAAPTGDTFPMRGGSLLKQVAASTGDTFSMRQESLLKQVAAPTGDMFLTRRGPLLKQVAAPQVIRSQPGDTTHAWEQRPQTVPLLRVLT